MIWPLLYSFGSLLIALLLIVYLFCKLDCDITLWLYEKFGKRASQLNQKVVWIVGASSGIGEHLAYELATAGSKLVLSGTRRARLDQVKQSCLQLNGRLKDQDILVIDFDVKDFDRHEERFNQVIAHFGQLDILVNNAGRTQRANFEETDLAVDKDMFDTNVFGLVKLTRFAVKHWYSHDKKGQIVVTSSTAGKVGVPFSCTYTATKHALHGYFEGLRTESHHRGIRVTMICPGPVFSEILGRSYTDQLDKKFDGVHDKSSKRQDTKRCAYLMAVSIVNQLDESWIAIQPVLTSHYLYQYMPSFARFIIPRLMTKDRIMKIRDG
ncbi:Dehydrogenase/reductase SDR family member 7 [Halotydeus destructor]|nr:Dehydrogenase/reductase SDR family member 7 [Halotydeus destructor]